MKKTIISVLVFILVLCIMTGCQSKNIDNSNNDDNKNNVINSDNNNDSKINTYYTIKDDNEEDLCALFFLGYGEEEMKSNFVKISEEYKLPLSLENTKDYSKVDMIGDEWYLIIPKYKDSSIRITHLAMGSNGDTIKDGGAVETSQPVLLQCNASDIFPSSEVVISYKELSVTFSPFISLKDGTLVDIDNVYTH